MKYIASMLVVVLLIAGCAINPEPAAPQNLDADFAKVLEALGTENALSAMEAFDNKYGTTLAQDYLSQQPAQSRLGGGSSYPLLSNMPFNCDGAVYLSGGTDGVVSSVISWVAPKNFPGGYYHGAVLDLDKFDPNNLSAPALETAVAKGAGWESAQDWMQKVNAAVFVPTFSVNQQKLNTAQQAAAYYCDLPGDQQKYGFFKNYVDIFNVVTKEDTYWWYCTKVVWYMYKTYGIDIDSNDTRVDFTTSGLYSLVKAYYNVRYFFNSSKVNAAVNAYINDARSKIVMAEEIMLSPYLRKVFEAIRE
ncbi:MAG TPA: hypothetical protein P5519_02110 [Spirochaetia bacterium]|nr:hypothetical protein [Spirochaetales bacterium]HRS64669.1 hypothetical protein [Spirochaetia bacterium]HPD79629.1 hypothetical protein [Spirochaetales bacterium]HQG40449.1 hypothetical protein [Spirochaetales bacterium]HQK33805.1 hypothetical protein [Spirochaetales bacterium]